MLGVSCHQTIKTLSPTKIVSTLTCSPISSLCSRPRSEKRAEALMQQKMQKRPQLLCRNLRASQQSHIPPQTQGHIPRTNLPRTQCALRLYRLVCHLPVPLLRLHTSCPLLCHDNIMTITSSAPSPPSLVSTFAFEVPSSLICTKQAS